MDIPNLGKLMIRNNIAGIEFDEFLVSHAIVENKIKRFICQDATNKTIKEQRQKQGNSLLTRDNLELLTRQGDEALPPGERPIEIDEGAQTWLKTNLDIDVKTLKGKRIIAFLHL